MALYLYCALTIPNLTYIHEVSLAISLKQCNGAGDADAYAYDMERSMAHSVSGDLSGFLEVFDSFEWFAHVGEPVDDAPVRVVGSWAEARECLLDESWTHASFLLHLDGSHSAWDLGYDRALRSVKASGRNQIFDDGISVASAAASYAAAAAYEIAAGTDERFFVQLMDWYRRGHWPCERDAVCPDGKLIIY